MEPTYTNTNSMMRLPRILWLLLAAVTGLSSTSLAAPAENPPRRFDLGRLGKLLKHDLTHEERARLGMSFLREEVDHPTTTYWGSGGPIYHEYVLAQIVKGLSYSIQSQPAVDRELLWKEYQSSPRGEFQDMLALALASTGDRRTGDHAAAYLQNLKNSPVLRQAAAEALGEIQETRYIPLLIQVLAHDPHYIESRSRDANEKLIEIRTFHVRQGARQALVRLERKGIDIGSEARQARRSAVMKVSRPLPEPGRD